MTYSALHILFWDVSYASSAAHLAPPKRHVQLKECCGREQRCPLASLYNKQTPLNYETIKRLVKRKTQEKFFQEATASSRQTQWHNIKSTWEHNKNKPRRKAVANLRLNTGHDCLPAHLYRIKISSHNYCTICKQKNTIMDKEHLLKCPKLDNTTRDLSKLYWDARKLME